MAPHGASAFSNLRPLTTEGLTDLRVINGGLVATDLVGVVLGNLFARETPPSGDAYSSAIRLAA